MRNFWCEVNLKKIEKNINLVENLVGDKKIIGVIKGDAYGLGVTKISEFLQDKVDLLAVGCLDESEQIQGEKEILILSPLCTLEVFECKRENIVCTIDNEEILEKLPKDLNRKVQIYVDTGMNRMGIKPNRLDLVINTIKDDFPNITITGIYTHLHNSKKLKYTLKQVYVFRSVVEKYIGEIPYIHCMASSGVLNDEIRKACDFTTAVRLGNVIYGYIGLGKGIKKVFDYYARPINCCRVNKGEYVGYGCLYKAKKDMTIGVLKCGNIHGLGVTREIKNHLIYDIFRIIFRYFKRRHVIFNGNNPVIILGKPNMNVTLIDMNNIDVNDKLKVDISPIISNSNIEKFYMYE